MKRDGILKRAGATRVKPGHTFDWLIQQPDGRLEATTCTVLSLPCPMCRAIALVMLPPSELAKQVDGTTHVCHPAFKGCNHGFAASSGLTAVEGLS